ncbi:MAG: ornithine cyclodeaminase family protein [Solirubrobacterales bacterium]
MSVLRLIDHDQVLAAIDPAKAIECVRDGFKRYALGEWRMPSKVYLDSAPHGDFRAMPAHGDGLAIVKWITSFPGNPAKSLPTVTGIIIVSDAETGEPQALIDARAVTALRTGAVAAVATQALAPAGAEKVGIVGCGLHGAWVGRCMSAAGFVAGVCSDRDDAAAAALAGELGWQSGDRAAALSCDVVCTITPGDEPVVDAADVRAGQHLNALGADGPGKAEFTLDAVAQCDLYCDEWEQASHGGELTGAVESGAVTRENVGELGALLLAGERRSGERASLFDSTGLAIQDLAICSALIDRLASGDLDAPIVEL